MIAIGLCVSMCMLWYFCPGLLYYDWSEHWYVCEPDSKMDRRRRSSIFDSSIHLHGKVPAVGSSTCAFSCEPNAMDEFRTAKMMNIENSYQLDPTKSFCPDKVEAIIKGILETNFHGKHYDHTEFKPLIKRVTDQLKSKIKELRFRRYKLICNVLVGENKDQGIQVGSRFLWDSKRDNYASASYVNTSLFATGTVFAIYFE